MQSAAPFPNVWLVKFLIHHVRNFLRALYSSQRCTFVPADFAITFLLWKVLVDHSNRSQMMSKCGKNKKVAHVHEAIVECVTDAT